MVSDPYAPGTLGKSLCTYRLWPHLWTRWQREMVTSPYGEIVLLWYRSCNKCGWLQSKHEIVVKGPATWPKHLKH